MPICLMSVPTTVRYELLALALIGTVSSTVFLALVLVAARRFRKSAQPVRAVDSSRTSSPGYHSQAHLRAGAATGAESCKFLRTRLPGLRNRLWLPNGGRPRPGRGFHPACPLSRCSSPDSLFRIPCLAECKGFFARPDDRLTRANNYFVISDSDILVTPDFLRNIVSPLLDPQVGLVTCLYSGTPNGDFWSRVEALGMSIEMPSGVLVAKLLEGMKFALGAGIALRRDVIDRIGGFASISDYCADDFILGKRVAESGYSVVLSRQIVSHVLIGQGFVQTFRTQLRWMQSTRFSRPKGHLGTVLTFSMPFGLLGLFSAVSLGYWRSRRLRSLGGRVLAASYRPLP